MKVEHQTELDDVEEIGLFLQGDDKVLIEYEQKIFFKIS